MISLARNRCVGCVLLGPDFFGRLKKNEIIKIPE
jgi:hypothetical protein